MDNLTHHSKIISEQSVHVRIDHSGIERFCKSFDETKQSHWLTQAPFDVRTLELEDRLAYLTVFNSISFSYWGEPKWTIEYQGKHYDGAWAMLACIGKSVREQPTLLHSDTLSTLSVEQFKEILAGNTQIPLLSNRLSHVHEVGNVVSSRYGKKFRNFIEDPKLKGNSLLETIVQEFPSFRDVSIYGEECIEFNKRARLLVSDIAHTCPEYHMLGNEIMVNSTACADYKLPQVMRRYGILTYSPELSHIVESKIEIPKEDKMEIEIRANTIHAIECIKHLLMKTHPTITSMDINDYVWLEGQKKFPTDTPYHRTRTIAY